MLECKQCWSVNKNEGLEFEASLEARVSHLGHLVRTTNWKGIISAISSLWILITLELVSTGRSILCCE